MWVALLLGILLGTADAFGSGLIHDWWQAFFLLAVTGALNLIALRNYYTNPI
jgi:hypothetical protein